ncbi:MAG: hypothetical protein ACC656_12640, partial [Candidatus Heimdallarchaeota archaeon]
KYLDLAERAGNWLLEHSFQFGSNSVYWLTVGEEGFTSTDYYYGGAGIVDSLLKIYSKTKNTTFLDYAVNGANWIISSKIITNETNKASYFPWTTSNISFFKDIVYSGQLNGIAGIGKVFLNLYRNTNDINWLTQSKQLGYWLQSVDFNDTGLFPNGGAPYITGLYEGAPNILGYGSGSLGIAEFYLQLFLEEDTQNVEWLYEIIRITSSIEQILDSNSNYFLPIQKNTTQYLIGLQSGIAAVIKVYSQLIQYFNQTNQLATLKNLLNSLKTLTNQFKGSLPEDINQELINNNRENGLAGILESLSYVLNLEGRNNGQFSDNYVSALESLPKPKFTYVPSVNSNFYFSILSMIFLLIVAKKRAN